MISPRNLWCLESSVNWKEDYFDLIYVYQVCFIFKIVPDEKKKGKWEQTNKQTTTANNKTTAKKKVVVSTSNKPLMPPAGETENEN